MTEEMREVLRQYLKDNLSIEARNMPQYHGGEKGPLYLALVLEDKVITSLDSRTVRAIVDGKEDSWD